MEQHFLHVLFVCFHCLNVLILVDIDLLALNYIGLILWLAPLKGKIAQTKFL